MAQLKFRPVRRVKDDAELAGVCAGIAYSTGIHVQIVRLMVLAAIVLHPATVLAYLTASLLVPKWAVVPVDYSQVARKRQ